MIRLALESDAASIGAMWAEMAAWHAALDADAFRPSADGARQYARGIVERLQDPQARVLVAVADDETVGFVMGVVADLSAPMFEPLRCGYLADIFVRESHRRRGLGRQLVAALARWFRSRDLRHFEWQVSARNEAGLAFWRALGGEATMLRMRASLETA